MSLHRVLPCLAILFACSATAQTKLHVLDINQKGMPVYLTAEPKRAELNHYKRSHEFVTIGGVAIFQARTAPTGRELFATRPGVTGVELILDIEPGAGDSFPSEFVTVSKLVYFSATQKATGTELWVTDGTAKGTRLVADIEPNTASSNPLQLCALGTTGKVVFRARTVATGEELFISDGTAAGTILLKEVQPGANSSYPSYLATFNDGKRDLVIFHAYTTGMGYEPWITDGTAAGTVFLKDINAGTSHSYAREFHALGNRVLFTAAGSSTGRELWTSDGTPNGTVMLKDISPGSGDGAIMWHALVVGGKLYFEGVSNQAGAEVWLTDGTTAGTRLVFDCRPGSAGASFRHPAALGNKILFSCSDGTNGYEPWILDTVTGKAQLLLDLSAGSVSSSPTDLTTMGNKVIFLANTIPTGLEIFVSDGTAAGTKLLMDSNPGNQDGRISSLTTLANDKLVFSAQISGVGSLLVTDGTGPGTATLPVIIPQKASASSDPSDAVPFGRYLVFSADDGKHGRELWITDGTAAGSRMVIDLFTGNDKLGKPNSSAPTGMTVLGNRVLFAADDGKGKGRELWCSDGTATGTQLLADVFDGPSDGNPVSMERIGATVIFAAFGYDNATPRNYVGQELFITDGTKAGTRLLADLTPGIIASDPVGFTELGSTGICVFAAYTYSKTAPYAYLGRELWISDGTTAGTQVLMDLYPGSYGSNPQGFVPFGEKVCFLATANTVGRAIWITDGTVAGTKVHVDLAAAGLTDPMSLVVQGGKFYFQARLPNFGRELCVSDGTQNGTKMLKDLYPGSGYSSPSSLTAAGSRHVWFSAKGRTGTAIEGRELWSIDVLTGKVQLEVDIGAGAPDGNPVGFARRGQLPYCVSEGRVFFSAWTAASGTELMFVENGATAQAQGQPCHSSTLESTDPVLGRTVIVSGKTRAGFLGNVLLLGGASPMPVRMNGPCMLYVALFGPMITMQVSTGTTYGLQVPIPASPSLSGMQLLLQSVHVGATFPATSGFSNAVEWTLGS